MRQLFFAFLFGVTTLSSCNLDGEHFKPTAEIWKSELIRMKSETREVVDSFTMHAQYLYLYENGVAYLLDSAGDGRVQQSKTSWEIRERKGRKVFLFGYGQESQGILGVAYPIVVKNEREFTMAFDTLTEVHLWRLKRVENQPLQD